MANNIIETLNMLGLKGKFIPSSRCKTTYVKMTEAKHCAQNKILMACQEAIRNFQFVNVKDKIGAACFQTSCIDDSSFKLIVAKDTALPGEGVGATVDALSNLPSEYVSKYGSSSGGCLLPEAPTAEMVNKIPIICGSEKGEYPLLLNKLHLSGMIKFQDFKPKVINGYFGVSKPDGTTRFIMEMRRGNLFFDKPDDPALPNPHLLGELLVPPDNSLYVGKCDLSNYYHRIKVPEWLSQYFGLPPVSSCDLKLPGPKRLVYPCSVSMPMGWSHSVKISQLVHGNIILGLGLPVENEISKLNCPVLSSMKHGHYIDDFFLLGFKPKYINSTLDQYIGRMKKLKLPPKLSKIQKADKSLEKVTVLGADIHQSGTIFPKNDKLALVVGLTNKLISTGKCTSKKMSSIIGHWNWFILLRRAVFAVLKKVYKFIEIDHLYPVCLSNEVIWELKTLVVLAPLIFAKLNTPFSEVIISSDASLKGSGVAYTSIDNKKYHKLYQYRCTNGWYTSLKELSPLPKLTIQPCLSKFLLNHKWKWAVAHKWKYEDHITILEAHALLQSVKWFSRSFKHIGSRVGFFIDSSALLGAMVKGRSSSSRLLTVIRRISGHLLAGFVQPCWFWVPTDLNPADAPSRFYV